MFKSNELCLHYNHVFLKLEHCLYHVHYQCVCYRESNIINARCATSVWLPPAPPREQFVQQAMMCLFLFHFSHIRCNLRFLLCLTSKRPHLSLPLTYTVKLLEWEERWEIMQLYWLQMYAVW